MEENGLDKVITFSQLQEWLIDMGLQGEIIDFLMDVDNVVMPKDN